MKESSVFASTKIIQSVTLWCHENIPLGNVLRQFPVNHFADGEMLSKMPLNNNSNNINNNNRQLVVLADHRIKQKECEKKDKPLDLAREQKKLWNVKVKLILIVTCAFGTVTKGLLKGLEELEVGGRV